jgi:hypothetical protein
VSWHRAIGAVALTFFLQSSHGALTPLFRGSCLIGI